MTAEIRIVCNDGGQHLKRGPRNIITLRRLDQPGLDGAIWRELPVRSGKDRSRSDLAALLAGGERGTRETVITPEGERLTGARAGRTRSENAAKRAGYDPEPLRGSRLHLDLRCTTCKLDPSTSAETLDPILERLHEAGQEKVELRLIHKAVHLGRS